MAEIIRRESVISRNSLNTLGEKEYQRSGEKGLISSDLSVSEVIDTLSKRVRRSETYRDRWNYIITKIFKRKIEFDGMLDVNYSELATTQSNSPYDDVVIDDFNATTNKTVRFTYEAKTQSNVKTKLLSSSLMNFKTSPQDGIEQVFKNVENIVKTQDLFWANQLWTLLSERAKEMILDPTLPFISKDGESVAKNVYEYLKKFETSHKQHEGVGTDLNVKGVISKDVNGQLVSISPTLHFNSNEFYVITSIDYDASIVYNGEKVFYNYGAGQLEVAGHHTLDFLNAEEIPDAVRSSFTNTKVLLVHKDALGGIEDWEGTGIGSQIKLYQVVHSYLKCEAIPYYDKPILNFTQISSSTKTKK